MSQQISPAGKDAGAELVMRAFGALKDHEQCAELQRRIWGESNAVVAHMTVAIQRHGGVAIGAFDRRAGQLVGFVLSFLAPTAIPGAAHGLSHHSHMAGVAPEWQNRGIGTALKLAQREAVAAQGVNLITWTYDPLEARNARMNLHKLGARCRTYYRDYYGEMRDALNAGVASDRFEVEWWLDAPAPAPAPPPSPAASISPSVSATAVTASPASSARRAARIEINIPRDFQAMKRKDINLARAWRMKTRLQFEEAFSKGFAATDFVVSADRACYILS